ncbi:hypothetical protein B0H13DRAFT_1856002 [Mycena leptocephala]|nr:hypothetical protein B0H13DRAFT_1856002 [Mycena leptocephala]
MCRMQGAGRMYGGLLRPGGTKNTAASEASDARNVAEVAGIIPKRDYDIIIRAAEGYLLGTLYGTEKGTYLRGRLRHRGGVRLGVRRSPSPPLLGSLADFHGLRLMLPRTPTKSGKVDFQVDN